MGRGGKGCIILKLVVGKEFVEKVSFEQRLEGVRVWALQKSGRRAHREEGTARRQALRLACA